MANPLQSRPMKASAVQTGWALAWMFVSGATGGLAPAHGAAPRPGMALAECRLEHPLHLVSIQGRCGRIDVAENPLDPQGAHIELNVAVVPALNRRSVAPPLFVIAGGPGQSAAGFYVAAAGAFARINRDHDVVLLDQRGTGRSAPLNCDYPEDWQEPADPMPALRRATQDCLARFGPRVRYYTTSIAVGDLDHVREVLGYGRIDLYAVSYGTRVAELYMRRYAQHLHGVILDGVTYPEQIIGPHTPLDAQRALDLIVARCAAAPACLQAFPRLGQELQDLRRRYGAQRTPLILDDPNSGMPQHLDFSRAILNAALRFLSYSASQAALLPVLIHDASQGALAPLAAQTVMSTRQVGDQLASGMQYSVICSEDEPFFDQVTVDAAELAKSYQGAEQLDALRAVCALWPRGPVDADLHAPLRSDVPTLLLSGSADPVTPPADAERAAAGLMHHRHLILDGEGHGQLSTGCVPRLMAEFLDEIAPDKLDAQCLRNHLAAPFFVNTTGPVP